MISGNVGILTGRAPRLGVGQAVRQRTSATFSFPFDNARTPILVSLFLPYFQERYVDLAVRWPHQSNYKSLLTIIIQSKPHPQAGHMIN